MLFSIIVTAYNTEKWLNRCVDSILGQNFGDFELILVDDGSTDRSGEICDSYAARDGRVRVIHQKNGGYSAALNAGLSVMRGEYVLFVDSDDWVEPNWLEEISAALIEKPVDVVIWGLNEIFSDKTKKRLFDDKVSLEQVKVKFLRDEWPCYVWNKCWKRELFNGVRFPSDVVFPVDCWTVCSLIVNATSVSFINKYLYNYSRGNPASDTNTMNSLKYYWFMRTLLRNAELARQAGVSGAEVPPGLPYAAYHALLAHRRDGLLTAEQEREVADVIRVVKNSVKRLDARSQYQIYHSLSRGEKTLRHYGAALTYFVKYLFRKAGYLPRGLCRG